MLDDLDERNRASSTASSRRGDRRQDGDSHQFHQSADLDAAIPIQTVPGAVRSGEGVRQIEQADGRCDRPSSMPDGQRRTAAARNAVGRFAEDQFAEDQIAADQGAMRRIGRDQFQRVPALDGILPVPDAPSA